MKNILYGIVTEVLYAKAYRGGGGGGGAFSIKIILCFSNDK